MQCLPNAFGPRRLLPDMHGWPQKFVVAIGSTQRKNIIPVISLLHTARQHDAAYGGDGITIVTVIGTELLVKRCERSCRTENEFNHERHVIWNHRCYGIIASANHGPIQRATSSMWVVSLVHLRQLFPALLLCFFSFIIQSLPTQLIGIPKTAVRPCCLNSNNNWDNNWLTSEFNVLFPPWPFLAFNDVLSMYCQTLG